MILYMIVNMILKMILNMILLDVVPLFGGFLLPRGGKVNFLVPCLRELKILRTNPSEPALSQAAPTP